MEMRMLLSIYPEKKISEVQKEFNEEFPFLKLEFFKNGMTRKQSYPSHLQIPQSKMLQEAWNLKRGEGNMEIQDEMTVAELENLFMDRYNLSVQVFRRSGNIWLETTMTDNWTLRQQNEHGKEISDTSKSW
jgi:hypothetical protein